MTWQGGKRPPEQDVPATFAPLQRFLEQDKQDPEEGFQKMAQALRDYGAPVRIHVRLLNDEQVEHWEVEGGKSKPAARRKQPKKADVVVIARRETWLQIAQGRLSPFDALFSGNLRIGGDIEAAKRIARHLSDPSVPFVAPC
jgi:putative sterol carrier protein